MPSSIYENTEINQWKKFIINHDELNGQTIQRNLISRNEYDPDLLNNGVYCHSTKYEGVSICLRIGTAFGNKSGILKRLECHRGSAVYKQEYRRRSTTMRKYIERYELFFNDIFRSTDLIIHYKPLLGYHKEQLLELEKTLIIQYLPLWEFPFDGIAKKTERLLEFGKIARGYAEKKIN